MCERLVLSEELAASSTCATLKHQRTRNLDVLDLLQPTLLLPPKDKAKANAQYFFSDSTVHEILTIVRQLGYRKVLCIGAPRIHEAIQLDATVRTARRNGPSSVLQSLLLDWDSRFAEWYGPTFVHYNMFNGHCFDGQGLRRLRAFLPGCDVVIVDPPFGGVLMALAAQLRALWACMTKLHDVVRTDAGPSVAGAPTMLCLPYFNEVGSRALHNLNARHAARFHSP